MARLVNGLALVVIARRSLGGYHCAMFREFLDRKERQVLQSNSVTWLVVGAALWGGSIRLDAIPILTWLVLACMLRASRRMRAFPRQIFVGLALYVALAVGNRGYIPIPGPVYYFVIVAVAAVAMVPFVADRIVAPRIAGWWSTLIFPMAWVVAEFGRSRLIPGASWGSIAYTQYGNLALMQLVAVTGIWGISFLIAWFAAILNWAAEHDFAWATIRGVAMGYAIVLCGVLVGGGLRLALANSDGRSMRAAVVSFPKELFVPGEVTRIVEGRVDGDQRVAMGEKVARLHEWFLESARREARSGAKLVA